VKSAADPAAAPDDHGFVATPDGLRLYWRRWWAASAKGVLLLVHGLAEHLERYAHVASYFAERGFVVLALDYRGHGRSEGPRVHVDRFDRFVDDVALLRQKAHADHPGLPLYLIGHSQGGLVALRSALSDPARLAGAVVSSPVLGVHRDARPSVLTVALARVLSVVAPGLRLPNHVIAERVSRDPDVVAAYRRDPLVSRRVSSRWYVSLQNAVADTHARAGSFPVPLLLMVSGSDLIVDPEAAARWASRAPASLVEFVRWDGLYHEMFNEPERQTVLRRVHSWLSAQQAAAAASR
jgi:acylglycerol lipase